jgi:16S rRNA (cytosine1402-N4)-methyltransferase
MRIEEILKTISLSPDHQPVLLREVLEGFSTATDSKYETETKWSDRFSEGKSLRYFDGTFGRGGHYKALKMLFPQMRSYVMDQDQQAQQYALENFRSEVQSGDMIFSNENFSNFSQSKLGSFDMMLLDLGVSSPQLDQADRGFSFYHAGPLDMRMNQSQYATAEIIINTWDEKDLVALFQKFGEVYKPFRVVRAIVHDRKEKAFQTTDQLAGLIERVDGWRKKGMHPATQYFMALRLAVNNELEVLEKTLPLLMSSLEEGGRLAVISFHSLEDRIVKNLFRNSDLGVPINKRVIVATDEEIEKNPRARSAKLRVFERRVQDELGKSKSF